MKENQDIWLIKNQWKTKKYLNCVMYVCYSYHDSTVNNIIPSQFKPVGSFIEINYFDIYNAMAKCSKYYKNWSSLKN